MPNQPDQQWKQRKRSESALEAQPKDNAGKQRSPAQEAQPSRRRRAAHQKAVSPEKRRWLYIAGAAVFLLLFIYGATQLFLKREDTRRTEEINARNRALLGTDAPSAPPVTDAPAGPETAAPDEGAAPAPQAAIEAQEPAPTGAPSPAPRVTEPVRTKVPVGAAPAVQGKFGDIYAGNTDFVGWLKTDAVYRIDFAVVQGDNSFYMTHDFTKAENREGTAFLDETNVLWPRDDNLIIYAHNMKSGSMFGELNAFRQYDTIKANPFTTFDTIYENGTYIPFSVFVCDVSDPRADLYFNFYIRNFKTESSFNEFMSRVRSLSLVNLSNVDVGWGDQLLTLSTCYDDANKMRFIVMLRRLREGETRETAQQKYFN